MKLMFKQDVLLGNVKFKGLDRTTELTRMKKGDVFSVCRAQIGHDRRQHYCATVVIEWEKDGWWHEACLGTSHYPAETYELIPESLFEDSLMQIKAAPELKVLGLKIKHVDVDIDALNESIRAVKKFSAERRASDQISAELMNARVGSK